MIQPLNSVFSEHLIQSTISNLGFLNPYHDPLTLLHSRKAKNVCNFRLFECNMVKTRLMTSLLMMLLNMSQETSNVHMITFENGISLKVKVYNK